MKTLLRNRAVVYDGSLEHIMGSLREGGSRGEGTRYKGSLGNVKGTLGSTRVERTRE